MWVKNNQLSCPRTIYNVRIKIEYQHSDSEAFVIQAACWWHEPIQKASPVLWPTHIDLDANESQCVPVFMQPVGITRLDPPWPQSALDETLATRSLKSGRWKLKLTVTADSTEPLIGQIEFTVYQQQGVERLSIGCQPPMGDVWLPFDPNGLQSNPAHTFHVSDVWRWIGGKWKWGTLVGASIALSKAGEYAVGLLLLLLSAMAATSQIFHWKKPHSAHEPTVKILGYFSVVVVFIFLTVVTFKMKGISPWSHLQPATDKAEHQPAASATTTPPNISKGPKARSPQHTPTTPLVGSPKTQAKPISYKATTPAVVNNCPNGICISGGTVRGNPTVINNPAPPEQAWQLSIAKCDDWMHQLDSAGSGRVSIGNFISDNDAARIASILVTCFNRSGGWKPVQSFLPVKPDGVQIGAAADSPVLDVLESGLRSIGFRVPGPRDIRAAYGNEIDIIVGSNPIAVNH